MNQDESAHASAPPTPKNAGEMLNLARAFLERKDLPEARLEAELLVAHSLELDRLKLYLQLDRPVSTEEVDRARALLVRRAAREPVAYITGEKEFYGRNFSVGPGVLIPRPETELLVDIARAHFGATRDPEREETPMPSELRICDVGTGSGCLAVTLALELPNAFSVAIDLSSAALACARANAEALNADVQFQEGDALRLLRDRATRIDPTLRFELLVSNPPYVEQGEAESLEREVRDFEPGEALFAPKGDPDYWVRSLLEVAPTLVEKGGLLLVELGHDQAARVTQLCDAASLDAQMHADLDGHLRVLEVRF